MFVCCLYASKAVVKIVRKSVEDVAVDGTWDMLVEGAWTYRRLGDNRKVALGRGKGTDSHGT